MVLSWSTSVDKILKQSDMAICARSFLPPLKALVKSPAATNQELNPEEAMPGVVGRCRGLGDWLKEGVCFA